MIELINVCKEFRSGRGYIQALSQVTLTVDAGRKAAVVGASGSGKTTLLNCIGGLERPEKGSVICFDTDILRLSGRELSLFQRRNVGFVFQHGNLLSYLTVFENIALPLILNGIGGKKKTKSIEGLLERIDLQDAKSALPHELSGGEIQRVAVARAIAHKPCMLLADEPTASLDSETGKKLVALMFELGKENGSTIIIATHDLAITDDVDQIINFMDGRIMTAS